MYFYIVVYTSHPFIEFNIFHNKSYSKDLFACPEFFLFGLSVIMIVLQYIMDSLSIIFSNPRILPDLLILLSRIFHLSCITIIASSRFLCKPVSINTAFLVVMLTSYRVDFSASSWWSIVFVVVLIWFSEAPASWC